MYRHVKIQVLYSISNILSRYFCITKRYLLRYYISILPSPSLNVSACKYKPFYVKHFTVNWRCFHCFNVSTWRGDVVAMMFADPKVSRWNPSRDTHFDRGKMAGASVLSFSCLLKKPSWSKFSKPSTMASLIVSGFCNVKRPKVPVNEIGMRNVHTCVMWTCCCENSAKMCYKEVTGVTIPVQLVSHFHVALPPFLPQGGKVVASRHDCTDLGNMTQVTDAQPMTKRGFPPHEHVIAERKRRAKSTLFLVVK